MFRELEENNPECFDYKSLVMRWIFDKISWWIDLCCGEMTLPLQNKRMWKAGVVIFVHLLLIAAIVGPFWPGGAGFPCWGLLAFCLVWNACLDEYGTMLAALRKRIIQTEEKAGYIAVDTLGNRLKKFFVQYIRLAIPALFGIFSLAVWICCVLLLGK